MSDETVKAQASNDFATITTALFASNSTLAVHGQLLYAAEQTAELGTGMGVEQKFGEQNFRLLSEMTLQNRFFLSQFDQNADTDSAKI